jgi:hypothetical protein
MVSNLSTIGFEFADDASFQATMQKLAGDAFERLACAEGDYAIWRSRTSAEIWFHITGERQPDGTQKDRDVIGLTPFFEGVSDVAVEIVETVVRAGDNDFAGAFLAWVDPDEDSGLGAHQIVFDAVDFAAHCDRPLPFMARAKLTGFARSISIVAANDAAGNARAASSARGFMAIGLFAGRDPHSDEPPPAPTSNAVLTGRVVEHSKLANEETGTAFHWLLVETADATFDIVADPELVPLDLAAGVTVQIGCLFFGRILG